MDSEAIKKMVDQMFSDTSVPVGKTKEDLKDILEHIEILLDSLGD